MTPQQKWQEKMRLEGRCVVCGKEATSKSYCGVHTVYRRELSKKRARAKNGYLPWHFGGKGRPPLSERSRIRSLGVCWLGTSFLATSVQSFNVAHGSGVQVGVHGRAQRRIR